MALADRRGAASRRKTGYSVRVLLLFLKAMAVVSFCQAQPFSGHDSRCVKANPVPSPLSFRRIQLPPPVGSSSLSTQRPDRARHPLPTRATSPPYGRSRAFPPLWWLRHPLAMPLSESNARQVPSPLLPLLSSLSFSTAARASTNRQCPSRIAHLPLGPLAVQRRGRCFRGWPRH